MGHEGKRQVASSGVSSEDNLCELILVLWPKRIHLQANLHQKVYTRKPIGAVLRRLPVSTVWDMGWLVSSLKCQHARNIFPDDQNEPYSRMHTLISTPALAASFRRYAIQSRCASESGSTYPPPSQHSAIVSWKRSVMNGIAYRERKEVPSPIYLALSKADECYCPLLRHPPHD